MKVALVNPPLVKEKISRDMAGGLGFDATNQILLPPLDLALLAATLKEKHQVVIIDAEAEGLNQKQTAEKIIRWQTKVVISNVSLPSLIDDCCFLKKLKKINPKLKVIAKTSISYPQILKEILKRSGADFCLWGEADLKIDRIILGKTKESIAYFEGKKFIMGIDGKTKNLDKLPLPARGLLKNDRYRYPLLGNKMTIMQTSRGCPFPCAYYCPYPLVQGKVWRAMSPQRVILEINDIVKNHKINRILFRDATFSLDRNRTISICEKIINSKLKIAWWCETRLNCLDEELLKLMKQAGCKGINIGVETGDPAVMEMQGKPGVSLAQLEKIKQITDKLKIKLHFLLLIGLPKETRKSLLLTFKLIKRLKPYSLGVTVVTPYPGTQLYKDALKNKWIETQNWSRFSGGLSTMHTDNLSATEMKLAQKMLIAELLFLEKGFWGQLGLQLESLFFTLWAKI